MLVKIIRMEDGLCEYIMVSRLAHRYHSENTPKQLAKVKYNLNITLIMSIRNNSDCTEVQLDIFGPKGVQIKCLELMANERTQSGARICLSAVKIMAADSW